MDQFNIKQVNQLIVTAYMNLAERYRDDFKNVLDQCPFDRYLLDQISDSLEDGAHILDAGSGPSAQVGRYMLEKGHEVTASDICPRCTEMISDEYPQISSVTADMRNSGFKDACFDAIVARFSIFHTPRVHINKFFREFRDLLKPGGRLLIVVKQGKDEGFVTGDWWGEDEIYMTQFKKSELESFAREYGFSIDLLEVRKPEYQEVNKGKNIYLLCTLFEVELGV